MATQPVAFIRTTPTAFVAGSIWLEAARSGRPLIVALHGGGLTRRYFLEGEPSLVDSASAEGFDVALLDRPGYGDSRFNRRDGDILDDNAVVLTEAIGQLRDGYAADRPVYLLGHSIGGAIALMIAARRPAWLGAVSVSGIGDVPPSAAIALFSQPPAVDAPPPDLARTIFLTPEAAADEAVAALDRAAGPVVPEELEAIYSTWTSSVSEILSKIVVPTQVLLAEHETLWETGPSVADRIAEALRHAPRKDVAVIPGVAHCIEYHPQARAFYARILNFASTQKV